MTFSWQKTKERKWKCDFGGWRHAENPCKNQNITYRVRVFKEWLTFWLYSLIKVNDSQRSLLCSTSKTSAPEVKQFSKQRKLEKRTLSAGSPLQMLKKSQIVRHFLTETCAWFFSDRKTCWIPNRNTIDEGRYFWSPSLMKEKATKLQHKVFESTVEDLLISNKD